jgi:hypothetical protein
LGLAAFSFFGLPVGSAGNAGPDPCRYGSVVISRRTLSLLLLLAAGSSRSSGQTVWRVTVMGSSSDSRVTAVREAIAFWNAELGRLRSGQRIGAVSVTENPVPEEVLGEASRAVEQGRRPRDLSPWIEPRADELVVVLAGADLMSFAVRGRHGAGGVVVLRTGDDAPLSLPNVARNVAAHELGHLLGLEHNDAVGTLMCGRPARCRPDNFASETPRFFPLTADDERVLRENAP